MRKKIFIVTALVLAVAAGLAASAVAYAQARHGRHNGWMLRRMTRELNLTADQQAQIKTILQTQKAKMQPLIEQLHQQRLAESGNVTGSFDEAQVRASANQQAQIMSDLTVERARTKSQIYAVLTPGQRAKAQQLLEERRQHRRRRGEKFSQPAQQPPG